MPLFHDVFGARFALCAVLCTIPAARCAFEWMLRHEPQRAEREQSGQCEVATHAWHVRASPQELHLPSYTLVGAASSRPRLPSPPAAEDMRASCGEGVKGANE